LRFDTISALSILAPLLSALLTFSKQERVLRKFCLFILFSALAETAAIVYANNGWNNMPVSHVYTYGQVMISAWIFYDLVTGYKKKTIVVLLISFLCFSIINEMFWEAFKIFNSNQRYFAGITMIIFCTMYFAQLFKDVKIVRVEHDPYFWMSASLLIYIAGTLFLFIMTKELMKSENNATWNLNCLLNIIQNTGFTIALWMGTRKSN
jgi:hypothetical protein